MAMPLMFKGAVPVLLRVEDFAALGVPTVWFAKTRFVALKTTLGAAAPMPLRVTDCGELGAVLVRTTLAPRIPAAVGLNDTEIEHDAPTARVLEQVLVNGKSAGFAPVTVTVRFDSVALPVFVIVRVCAALVDAISCCANVSPASLSTAAGIPRPIPVTVALCGEPAASLVIVNDALRDPGTGG